MTRWMRIRTTKYGASGPKPRGVDMDHDKPYRPRQCFRLGRFVRPQKSTAHTVERLSTFRFLLIVSNAGVSFRLFPKDVGQHLSHRLFVANVACTTSNLAVNVRTWIGHACLQLASRPWSHRVGEDSHLRAAPGSPSVCVASSTNGGSGYAHDCGIKPSQRTPREPRGRRNNMTMPW